MRSFNLFRVFCRGISTGHMKPPEPPLNLLKKFESTCLRTANRFPGSLQSTTIRQKQPTLFMDRICAAVPLPSQQYPLPLGIPLNYPPPKSPQTQRLPSFLIIDKLDPLNHSVVPVESPTHEDFRIEKSAARLVKIRHKKMKKHQYKKLKKRMGHVWEYYRNRRRMRRIKAFYEQQNMILKKARGFDPENYVRNFIATAKACQLEIEAAAADQKQKQTTKK